MSFLSALYHSYDSAEKAGLVDKHDGNETILLPLYHTSLNSTGKNIIKIILTETGHFYKAEILDKGAEIIFPVTDKSVARTGKNFSAHPLTDKFSYYLTEEPIKHENYLKELNKFIDNLSPSSDCFKFMKIVKNFITLEDMYLLIFSDIFPGYDYKLKGNMLYYTSGKKELKIKLDNYFLTFEILNFKDKKSFNVTNYVDLHQAYIRYVESRGETKGICCISGQMQSITTKHRGIMGNAKVVSVSNNKETYYGRFKDKSDILSVGYQTSEKAHLMLKFLLDNKNSCRWMGDQQYLINWFSDDIKNHQEFDLTDMKRIRFSGLKTNKINKPVTVDNKEVGNAFGFGWDNLNYDSQYYLAIVDQASNGRISIKYFRELPTSELKRNLQTWHEKYHWYLFNKNSLKYEHATASFYQIMKATYGIERDGELILPKKSFQKDLYVKMIGYLIDGARMPKFISKQLAINIRQRHRYDKTWKDVLFVAQGILNNERQGGYDTMLDKENNNCSYLYGRLLAIYDLIEQNTFVKENQNKDKRLTNAQNYWTVYNRTPATTMKLLENKVKPYEKKLRVSKPGLFYKLEKEKSEIINKLHDFAYSEQLADKSLDFDFIFGYQAEIDFVYTKKEKEEKQND